MDLLADDGLLDLGPQPLTSPQASARLAPVASGTCALCNARPARTACASCGLGVCSVDLWVLLGLCKACVAPTRGGTQ